MTLPYKEIILSQGRVAVVDSDQFDRVNQFKWCFQNQHKGTSNGYAVRNSCVSGIRGKIYMHRYILDCPLGLVVDHADGDGLNNRSSNLSRASYSENGINKKSIGGSSKYKGVCKVKGTGKYRTRIRLKQKFISLGNFKNEIEAAKAYDKKAVELFAEYAYLNFPDDYPELPPPF